MKRGNFRCTANSVGVEAQLSNLATITQVIDPKLHQHIGIFLVSIFIYEAENLINLINVYLLILCSYIHKTNIIFYSWSTEQIGGGDYLFAFRMIMVLFRREFSFCDSLYLWEVCFISVLICSSSFHDQINIELQSITYPLIINTPFIFCIAYFY